MFLSDKGVTKSLKSQKSPFKRKAPDLGSHFLAKVVFFGFKKNTDAEWAAYGHFCDSQLQDLPFLSL